MPKASRECLIRTETLFSNKQRQYGATPGGPVLLSHDACLKNAGTAAERRRVAQELHDDVIPPLLSFIYRATDPALADEGRRILAQLRGILRRLDGESAP